MHEKNVRHGHVEPGGAVAGARGWRNFERAYRDLGVDEWKVYDNSGRVPMLPAEGSRP